MDADSCHTVLTLNRVKPWEHWAMTVMICNQATSYTHTDTQAKQSAILRADMPWKFGWLLFWFVPSMVCYIIFKVGRCNINKIITSHQLSSWDSETIDQTNNNIQNTYNLPIICCTPPKQATSDKSGNPHTRQKSNLIWLLSLRSRLGCSDFQVGCHTTPERNVPPIRTLLATSRHRLTGMFNLSLVRLIRSCFYFPCCMTLLCLLWDSKNI